MKESLPSKENAITIHKNGMYKRYNNIWSTHYGYTHYGYIYIYMYIYTYTPIYVYICLYVGETISNR